MRTQQARPLPNLSAHALPGPDTCTKRKALESHDPRLRLMLDEATKVGWPNAFSDDLYVHDKTTLDSNPDATMLWVLRQHGTHLYPLTCANQHQASYYRSVIDYWSGDHKLNVANSDSHRARYYLVSLAGIERITAKEAGDRINVRPPP